MWTMDAVREAAEQRWTALVAERPELEPAIVLQRTLLTLVIETHNRLQTGRLPRLSLPPRYVVAKLERHVPILRGEPIPLPVPLLTTVLPRLCEALAAGGAGDTATHIRDALQGGRLDAGSLLTGLLARDQQRVRATAGQLSLSGDLLWLVGELAVGPFVHLLQASIVRSHESIELALRAWARGYCPVCGSWPAVAELSHGSRALRCSFCAYGWKPAEYACAYCGAQENFGPAAPDPERPDRLLELCRACAGYLKALMLPGPTEFPLAAIEDLATIDLDQAAMELGYVRPPLPSF
jgi:FdhE protein